MKKALGVIKSIIGKTGTFFMFVMLLFSTFITIVSPSKDVFMINTSFLWYSLLFSFVLALAGLLLKINVIRSFAIKVILHYIVATADFTLVLCIMSGAAAGSQLFVLTLAFTIIYAVVMTVYCLIRSILAKKENAEKEYSTQFTPKNDI